MSDLIGQTLGQYEILAQLGKGGMATVYRARQATMNREVAVKVLHKSLLEQDATFIERFRREAQVIAKLQHPHILPVYDFGEHDGQPYLVMALLSGGSLAERIRSKGAMQLDEVARILRPLAEALDFAHEQDIIHRDFKPANVMFDGRGYPYLADFGLAKMAQSSQITASAGIIGTPDYMAPDWSKEESVTYSVDIYALGVTLYQMLAGRVPYRATTPMGVLMAHTSEPIPDIRKERPDLPPEIQEVIEAALAKRPEDRFPTAAALVAGLMALAPAGISADLDVAPVEIRPVQAAPAGQTQAYHPNTWGHNFLAALEQELGPDDLAAVLIQVGAEHLIGALPPNNMKREFPIHLYPRIFSTIRDLMGEEAAIPLINRIGRADFKHAVPANKIAILAWEASSRLVALETRLSLGLENLARLFNAVSDQKVEVENHSDHLIWRGVANCLDCYESPSAAPPCEFMIGFLQAACEFFSAGGRYPVTEIACYAEGDSCCILRIDKTPMKKQGGTDDRTRRAKAGPVRNPRPTRQGRDGDHLPRHAGAATLLRNSAHGRFPNRASSGPDLSRG